MLLKHSIELERSSQKISDNYQLYVEEQEPEKFLLLNIQIRLRVLPCGQCVRPCENWAMCERQWDHMRTGSKGSRLMLMTLLDSGAEEPGTAYQIRHKQR